MDDNENILENFDLEQTILGSRNQNFNYIICKIGVDLNIIRFEDKILLTIISEVPYALVVARWLLEGCIAQAINDWGI